MLFLPSLMHKNKYSYYYPILPSLTPWKLGVLSFGVYDANILETPNQHNLISLSNAFRIRARSEARTNFPWSPQVK